MTAYLIVDLEIVDAQAFQAYREQVRPTLEAHGARVIAARGRFEVMEGETPAGGVVLIAFPSLESIDAWYRSPEYAEPLRIRLASTRSHVFAVEGTDRVPAREKAGYVIAQITVSDDTAYQDYRAGAGPAIEAFGGRFLARGGRTEAVEGEPLGERVVVIEFDSFERAIAWYGSPEYAAPLAIRKRAANATVWITEGL